MSCLMNFGELNIPSSRAFWDDCEDEENPIERHVLSLDYVNEDAAQVPQQVNTLLLLEGIDIEDFAEKVLLSAATKVCSVRDKKVTLYSLQNSKLLLAVVEEDLNISGEVTSLLLPYAKVADNVITINVKPKVDYKSLNISETKDKITFLRRICGNLQHIQSLEAPNFISGVSAGVGSWLDNARKPTNCYVAYADKIPLDGVAAQSIIKLLQLLGVPCQDAYKPKRKQLSHLYM